MAVKGELEPEDVVRTCIERYEINPSEINIFSAISRAFIDCYLESKAEDYISVFSRLVAERLKSAYLCGKLSDLFQMVSRRFDEIADELAKRYYVYELKLITATRLLMHTRSGQLPLEVSLAWDPMLNVPIIPSSSIKGIARVYFEEVVGPIGKYSVEDLFGYQELEGLMRFTDAYPVACRESLLEPEVITPHYSEVDGKVDEVSSKPIPLVFITVSPSTTFRLLIVIKTKKPEEIDEVVRQTKRALSKGIGAKTTLGYGRFTIQDERR